jgi:phosphoribosylaminoimidazole carboxylase
MAEYASNAASRGIKAIIAAAGGAAHLPGMAAAHTSLPVIGLPVKGSTLDGIDSLYSIVQIREVSIIRNHLNLMSIVFKNDLLTF